MADIRIKIVSEDGNPWNMRVVNADTGDEIRGITKIEILPITPESFVHARLTFEQVQLDLTLPVEGHLPK
jgi:hypothetical protein